MKRRFLINIGWRTNILLLFIFFFTALPVLFSQTKIDDLVQAGKYDEARILLPSVIKANPNDASTLYYQGLLEKDGDKSLEYFEKLLEKHPKSEYSDDALMQIGEYRYARGLYISAERTLLRIPRQYPESKHVKRAINLLMQSMLVTGKSDTARMYLKVFEKRWGDLAVDVDFPPVKSSSNEKISKKKSKKKLFTIQIGAFGSKDNAKKQREVFRGRGYDVNLGNKKVAGNTMHLVWVGKYSTYDEALDTARTLKAKFGVNYGIIDKSKIK